MHLHTGGESPATMKSLKMDYQDIEVPGGDHGSVISSPQAQVFAFFAKHQK